MDLEAIVVPICASILTFLATWLGLRQKAQEQSDSRRATERDADREAFDSIGERQDTIIGRLEERISDLEDARDRLDRELDAERTKRQQLEVMVGRFRVLFRLLRQVILARCGNGQACPLLPLLDDWERETAVGAAERPSALSVNPSAGLSEGRERPSVAKVGGEE